MLEQAEQAAQKDTNYASAYAGLADCYTMMERHVYTPADDAFQKARGYAERALELDEGLAEAHTSLAAILLTYDWDWKGAEDQFRRAIRLNPNYATAHYWYSVLLSTVGRLPEAMEEAELAQVLDPLSPVIGMGVVQVHFFSNQLDKAIEECKRYLDTDPGLVVAHAFLVHLFAQKGMNEEASAEAKKLLDLSERRPEAQAHIAYASAVAGRRDEAVAVMKGLMTDPPPSVSNSTIFITVWSILGDSDKAFDWAERAYESGRIAFPSLRFNPDLKNFRDDPRFVELLRRVNLE